MKPWPLTLQSLSNASWNLCTTVQTIFNGYLSHHLLGTLVNFSLAIMFGPDPPLTPYNPFAPGKTSYCPMIILLFRKIWGSGRNAALQFPRGSCLYQHAPIKYHDSSSQHVPAYLFFGNHLSKVQQECQMDPKTQRVGQRESGPFPFGFFSTDWKYLLQPALITAGEHGMHEEIFFQEVSQSCNAGNERERDAGRVCGYAYHCTQHWQDLMS